MRAALLIIDLQHAVVDEIQDKHSLSNCVETINWVAPMFRNSGNPVYAIKDIEEAELLSEAELDF